MQYLGWHNQAQVWFCFTTVVVESWA